MSNPAANAVANLLSKVARYSVLVGIGGSALQASLYTGALIAQLAPAYECIRERCVAQRLYPFFRHVQLMEVNGLSCMTEYREYCQKR